MSFPVLILSKRGTNGHSDGLLKGNPAVRREMSESEVAEGAFLTQADLVPPSVSNDKESGANALLIIITTFDLELVMTQKGDDPNAEISTPIRVPPGVPALLYNVLVGADIRGIHIRKAG